MKTIIRYFSFVMGLMLTLPSFAKEKISVMLDWYVNPDHAAIIVAQQKAFLKKITWRLKLSNLLILHYRRN